MYFKVLAHGMWTPSDVKSSAYLVTDNWDDWFTYETLYALVIVDEVGERHQIGGVKIGQFGMESEQRRPGIPEDFDELDERFFSLGQDDIYYEDRASLVWRLVIECCEDFETLRTTKSSFRGH
jgi:hypothetical protein